MMAAGILIWFAVGKRQLPWPTMPLGPGDCVDSIAFVQAMAPDGSCFVAGGRHGALHRCQLTPGSCPQVGLQPHLLCRLCARLCAGCNLDSMLNANL